LFGGVCALLIALDLVRHPQQMWIMNVVWPVTALFGSAWIVWQYLKYGRASHQQAMDSSVRRRDRLKRLVIALFN
jgi:hypothetical protein